VNVEKEQTKIEGILLKAREGNPLAREISMLFTVTPLHEKKFSEPEE
jgi:hypothetical protein|tara:strand:- start:12468 stop:12608 length:141 start_codon:yes stop_codon:yes gene_type:complete